MKKTAPSLETLLEKVAAYLPHFDDRLLRRAYELSARAHAGQRRLTGEPFVVHPLSVAELLTELEMDLPTLVAALLHDVVEDTGIALPQIAKEFGEEVAALVAGVTNLRRLQFDSGRRHQAENLRRMLMAMAQDVRVILIKLADRLHNLRTLRPLPPEQQKEVAEETLQIFAPLAHRLGVWRFKWELEDLSLRYLEPAGYRRIVRAVARSREKRVELIEDAIAQLQGRLEAAGLQAEITGRPKHFYSIHQKMEDQGLELKEILDLEGIRLILPSVQDCYAALGVVHSLWLPLPDMFTDYIAKPKPNRYQALHTKVVGPRGRPIEVQIRTREMHRTAEYGVAAHWRYKEGAKAEKLDDKLSWLRQLLELESELRDPAEWLESLKLDLFKDQVFVFTPKGEIVDLPAGATPIDFAYRIHTEVGHHCVGARVNGKPVPLDYAFKNGDIAEIITSSRPTARPSLDWLSLAATAQARSRIKAWYRRQQRHQSLERGRELLEEEANRQGLDPGALDSDSLLEIARKLNYLTADDLVAALGYGDLTAEAVINRLLPKAREEAPIARPRPQQGALRIGIAAQGADNLLFRLSRCCRPVPGDKIVGFVTRGKGMAVHRGDCGNLASLSAAETKRLLPLEWTLGDGALYPCEIQIEALDRVGLLNDISAIISGDETNIRSAKVQTRRPRHALFRFVLDVADLDHLNRVLEDIGALSDVIRVDRVRA
jgi:GTP pyrophosphokinase